MSLKVFIKAIKTLKGGINDRHGRKVGPNPGTVGTSLILGPPGPPGPPKPYDSRVPGTPSTLGPSDSLEPQELKTLGNSSLEFPVRNPR